MTAGRRAGGGRPRSARAHQAVLEAAAALLCEYGPSGTSMDAVARRAGVSKATIYRHWSSKEELCVEAVSCLTLAVDADEAPGDTRADLVETLRALERALYRSPTGRALPHLVGAGADHVGLARAWHEVLVAPARRRLAVLLRRAADDGDLRPDLDVELGVDLLIGPLLYRRLVTAAGRRGEELPERVVDALWSAAQT